MKLINTIILSGVFLLLACKNNKAEITADTCSTVNVRYSNTISSIISKNNCLNCHGGTTPSAPFQLETYAQVASKATEVRNGVSVLYGSVSHQSGFSPMPKNSPMITSCELSQLKAWIDAGTPQ